MIKIVRDNVGAIFKLLYHTTTLRGGRALRLRLRIGGALLGGVVSEYTLYAISLAVGRLQYPG